MDPKEYGEYLRKLRLAAGLTQDEAEEKARLSKGYLSGVENGRKGIPRPATLERLASAYNVPLDQLLQAAGVRFTSTFLEEKISGLSPEDRKTVEDLVDFLIWRRDNTP